MYVCIDWLWICDTNRKYWCWWSHGRQLCVGEARIPSILPEVGNIPTGKSHSIFDLCPLLYGQHGQEIEEASIHSHKSAMAHVNNVFVPCDTDLWPFDPAISGFPGLIVEHFCVKFDPKCISFWDIIWKNRRNKPTDGRVNAADRHTHATIVNVVMTVFLLNNNASKTFDGQVITDHLGDLQRMSPNVTDALKLLNTD